MLLFQLPFPQSNERLIQRMARQDNAAALRAAAELQERLCFQNGAMHGVDLSNANLTDVRLACASLHNVTLRNAVLVGAYFGASDLRGAQLQNAILRSANLREIRLLDADLSHAELTEAHMAMADLRGTRLHGARMHGANLWRARLQGADLTNAVLIDVNFYLTEFDQDTILPDGSHWTPHSDLTRFTGREPHPSLVLHITDSDAAV